MGVQCFAGSFVHGCAGASSFGGAAAGAVGGFVGAAHIANGFQYGYQVGGGIIFKYYAGMAHAFVAPHKYIATHGFKARAVAAGHKINIAAADGIPEIMFGKH